MDSCLPEDIIKCNFFRLSLPSQIKIYEMYLNDLRGTRYYIFFKEMFKKYISIAKRFNKFKAEFSSYTNDSKNNLRNLISKCRYKINPNNSVLVDSYSNIYQDAVDDISDSFVEKYIYDSFSYDRIKRKRIVLEFISCYSQIYEYDFEKLLYLFSGNKDLFNNEIKTLDSNFYSLYLYMDTVNRMKYVWHLAHFDIFNSDEYDEKLDEIYYFFEEDSTYIETLHQGNYVPSRVRKLSPVRYCELCRRFNMDG